MDEVSHRIEELVANLQYLASMLDEEHGCLLTLRYQDLLRVVTRKRSISSEIAHNIAAITSDGTQGIDGLEELKELALQVRSRSQRNHRLAMASVDVVDGLRGILLRGHPASGNYDNRGSSTRPCEPSTHRRSV